MNMDENVAVLPSLLERIGTRIDAAWKRVNAGEKEWVEGSLELASALAEARARHPANDAFRTWLKQNKHDHVNDHDRAALIGLASDLTLARTILTETKRRSYQEIWKEVKDRFAHASNSNKPKRGRRKGEGSNKRGRPHKPRNEEEKTAAEMMLDGGKSRVEVSQETGLTEHVVQLSMERELGRRETMNELLDAAAAKNFSEKGALRIEDAIRINRTRLDRLFEQKVNEEVRKRIAQADDHVRKHLKEVLQQNSYYQRIVSERGVFTETQFRQMIMLCHPDNSASAELRAELMQILIKNKIKLIKSE